MKFKPSLILKTTQTQKSLDSLINWLNKTTKSSFNHETVVNQANITLINQEGESIKIQTVREIKEQLAFSAYQANKTRYFVFLNADLATIPAQNALLKSIEEPPANTQIIFITSNPQKLLETIRSRCQLVIFEDKLKNKNEDVESNQKINTQIEKTYFEIIASNPGEQIITASKYKDRKEALLLCNQLINYLHTELKNKNTKLSTQKIVKNVSRLLVAVDHLEHNANVLLALENCFFELV